MKFTKTVRGVLSAFLLVMLALFVCCKAEVTPVNPEPEPEVTFTLSFNANADDVSGSMSSLTVKESEVTASIPKNTYTRQGYEFAGWNVKADGSGKSYSESDSITVKNDLTLYAQWARIVTITFVKNTPKVQAENPTETEQNTEEETTEPTTDSTASEETTSLTGVQGKEFTFPKDTFTAEGYKIYSWNTKREGGKSGKAYTAGSKYVLGANDFTVYAQWKIDNGSFIVTFRCPDDG